MPAACVNDDSMSQMLSPKSSRLYGVLRAFVTTKYIIIDEPKMDNAPDSKYNVPNTRSCASDKLDISVAGNGYPVGEGNGAEDVDGDIVFD